ncbi:MAG: DUF167 domain-containing protein [Nanoarchaeota archaeon]
MKVIVKPNSSRNEINYNEDTDVYFVKVKAHAEDNKANTELIKFLTKYFKRNVKIVFGFKNRKKILKFI